MQRVVHGALQLRLGSLRFFGIGSLVRIPYVSQTHAVLSIHMTTPCVNDPVSGAVFHSCTVDDLILAVLGREAERSVLYPCHIVRMRILVHIVIHVMICLRFVIIPEKLAEAVGERDGHDPFIYKLIYGKRHLHTFVSGLQLFIKVISLHKITVFLVGVKCCSGNLFIIMIRSLRSKTLADVQNHHSSFFT